MSLQFFEPQANHTEELMSGILAGVEEWEKEPEGTLKEEPPVWREPAGQFGSE